MHVLDGHEEGPRGIVAAQYSLGIEGRAPVKACVCQRKQDSLESRELAWHVAGTPLLVVA